MVQKHQWSSRPTNSFPTTGEGSYRRRSESIWMRIWVARIVVGSQVYLIVPETLGSRLIGDLFPAWRKRTARV